MKRLAIGFLDLFSGTTPRSVRLRRRGRGRGVQVITMSVSPAPHIERRSTQQSTVTVSESSSIGGFMGTFRMHRRCCGTISSGGLYTAPAMIPAKTTNSVTATLQSDSSKTSTATVTLQPLSVSVSPGSVSLLQGQTQQFTANVTGHSNKAVTWSLSDCSGAACGAIQTKRRYTAPASVTAASSVTVTATSQADTTKSGTATVQLQPPQISVSISPRLRLSPPPRHRVSPPPAERLRQCGSYMVACSELHGCHLRSTER